MESANRIGTLDKGGATWSYGACGWHDVIVRICPHCGGLNPLRFRLNKDGKLVEAEVQYVFPPDHD